MISFANGMNSFGIGMIRMIKTGWLDGFPGGNGRNASFVCSFAFEMVI